MSAKPRRTAPGPSKTDLRRGHLTPAHPKPPRAAHRPPTATTEEEQTFLFGEGGGERSRRQADR